MHERSLINALLRQVEKLRRDHGAGSVSEVRVEVGPLSGVEPLLLATAFEQLASASNLSDAKLVIDEVPLRAVCKFCDREFEVQGFVFRCPACGQNVRVIRGDEFQLVSVSLQEAERTQELAS